MPILTLDHENRSQLAAMLAGGRWVVACLCAAWCDSCCEYQATFETLAQRHPEKYFVWIDIEDQADLVGDLDVENFPTLLIQRAELVAFFGSIQPGLHVADRLITAQAEKDEAELRREAEHSSEHQQWQIDCNLLQRLHAAPDA
jgi:thioredoxin-like negative regulator of GroEL